MQRTLEESLAKIRLKHGPKQFKSGQPGICGRERLERRVRKLLLEANRYQQKPSTDSQDAVWARTLVMALKESIR